MQDRSAQQGRNGSSSACLALYESGNLKSFPDFPICNFLSKGPRVNDLMEKRQGDVSSVLFSAYQSYEIIENGI